ncbi:hypothetical protein AQJ58_20310 [Streptomyces sp. DSM 15324]|nr:hypothetical protein AQJ58_20310 [Streptomyces sp. DSM 15324]
MRGEPVAADRTQRQPQVIGIDLQRHVDAERLLTRRGMRAAVGLHRLDLQRMVADGELDALHLPDQFPVGGGDLLVAFAGYVADR